mmetsp:Transcript_7135/g.8033  ORF Transcript_7135/g.8033 Transcript_7135/m.8033 type:complete len:124 (+) Transcript_7135:19-390(+)
MAENKALNIECIKAWARAFQFIGAILLVCLGILRFVSIALTDPPTFILTLYYFAFAALIVIAEFQIRIVMQFFHFLYYSWGKAVLDFFLFTITFETKDLVVFQLPVSIFFFCTAVMYLIIAFA